jgi:hypothetical protein
MRDRACQVQLLDSVRCTVGGADLGLGLSNELLEVPGTCTGIVLRIMWTARCRCTIATSRRPAALNTGRHAITKFERNV